MSLLNRLFSFGGSGSVAEALDDLNQTRMSDRDQWDLEEQARIVTRSVALSELQRVQLRQAVNRSYWDRQWGWAIRQTKRNW